MNYSTLNGLTTQLSILKSRITALKSKCNSEILMLEVDQWSKVETYLQAIIDQVGEAKDTWSSTYGSAMQTLDEAVKSK